MALKVKAVEKNIKFKNTAIRITCIDRNGDEVRRVTSTDDGTVEEPDNSTDSGNTDHKFLIS